MIQLSPRLQNLQVVFSFASCCNLVSRRMPQYVFVYGTLKRDEPNHHWLTSSDNGTAKLIAPAATTVKYPLVIASKYNIPFLLDKEGTGEYVTGELYEIDGKMLQSLDVLEDYPRWYIRQKRSFKMIKNGEFSEVTAWVYLLQTFRDSLLELPFLKEYKSKGPHGLTYCEPAMRDDTYDACADVQGLLKVK